jgi:NAD(P)H dehydrogenase (quinone)
MPRSSSIISPPQDPRPKRGGCRVGLPYSFPGLTRMDEITGGGPYGATTLAGANGSRQPSQNELDGARFQGRHVAEIASRLERGARERG